MLTKMPKVGDVLIANDSAAVSMCEMTGGKEYVITKVDEEGDACFLDDGLDGRYIDASRFKLFTLKSEAHSESVGSIKVDEWETTKVFSIGPPITSHVVTLTVDDAGLASVRNLARQSGKQSLRNSIQTKIDALQKEMDAI